MRSSSARMPSSDPRGTVRPMRGLAGLILGQLSIHASMAGLRLAIPLQVLQAGGTKLEVGMLVAVFSLAQVLLALPAGRLTDRRGYHLPMRLAAVCTMAGASVAVASSLLPSLRDPLLALAALLAGAGANLGLIATQRTAGQRTQSNTELKRIFSWLGMAPSLSNVVGPAAAGWLIDGAGFGACFAFLALLPLGSLVATRFVSRESAGVPVIAKAKRPAWELLRGPQMQRLLLVNWFTSASWDLHSFLVPVLGVERGFSASAVGSILSTFAFAVTAIRFAIPLFASRLKESTVLRAALLTIAVMFAVYPWVSSAWGMALCALVLGVALGSSQPMVLTSLHYITPSDRRGEALALRSMTINAASTLAPLLFGALGTAIGPDFLFWAMSGLVGAGSFVTRSITGTSRGSGEAS
jgi:MFS family permease